MNEPTSPGLPPRCSSTVRRALSLVAAWGLLATPPGAHAGKVVAWGQFSYGLPLTGTNVTAIAAGGTHALALKADGTIVASGSDYYGQVSVPTGLSNVAAIAAGGSHSLALLSNGTVVAWGAGTHAEGPSPHYGQSIVPAGLANVVAVAAGGYHSVALRADGSVVAWGPDVQAAIPAGENQIRAIAAGGYHSLALRSNGTVVAWGENWYGACNVPPDLTNAVAVAAGDFHSVAIRSDGTVVAWGLNAYHATNVPPGLIDVVAIAAGAYHNLALKTNGTVVTWGQTDYGLTNVPANATNVVAIAAGGPQSRALVSRWLPSITYQPRSLSQPAGYPATFTVTTDPNDEVTFQWQHDGSAIPGATNATLTLPQASPADDGVYAVVVSNPFGFVISNPMTLTASANPPRAFVHSDIQRLEPGSNHTFTVDASGAIPLTFQWLFNGVTIIGATNSTLVISNATRLDAGAYIVVITNAFGSITSGPVRLALAFEHDYGATNGLVIYYPTRRSLPDQTVSSTQWFSSEHYRVTISGCGAAELQLDTNTMRFTGSRWCGTGSEDYYWFLGWRPGPATGSGATEQISEPAPEWLDGHWHLSLLVAPSGSELFGEAAITVDDGTIVHYRVTGTNDPATDTAVLALQCEYPFPDGRLTLVTAGPEMNVLGVRGNLNAAEEIHAAFHTPLSLGIEGRGKVSSLKNKQLLAIGETYTLVAKSAAGSLFSHWTIDDRIVSTPELRFVMRSNATVMAHFVPSRNAFASLKGTYSGLFFPDDAIVLAVSGLVRMNIRADGICSGTVSDYAGSHHFSGRFVSTNGHADFIIRRSRAPRLQLDVDLDADNISLAGTVKVNEWTVMPFTATRAAPKHSVPTHLADTYSLQLMTQSGDTNCFANGDASVTITPSGTVRSAGVLGDGTHWRSLMRISQSGAWPVYAPLYGRKGAMLGWMQASQTEAGKTVGGTLYWVRPSVREEPCQQGFSRAISVTGAESPDIVHRR